MYPSAPPKGPSRFTGVTGPGATVINEESQSPLNADKIWDPETRPSWLPPPPSLEPLEPQSSQGKLSPHELRTAVEAAKAQYKAEKERYRRERDERRRAKGERRGPANITPVVASSPLPISREISQDEEVHALPLGRSSSHIVSHARGPFPQLEMVSVPRRSATLGGRRSEEQQSRVQSRIIKRLADMGFSETSYPSLPDQVKAQLSQDMTFSKEMEDEIVTNLLETLLATSPTSPTTRTPIASGSGIRENIDLGPGGWH